MNVLVFEYITGGGMRQEPIPPALAAEGCLMLAALLDDLLAVPGLSLRVMQDGRLPLPRADPRIDPLRLSAEVPFQALWHSAIQACDAAWPIAPETDGILERLCLEVESAGKPLLTSPAAAVRLTASKSATAQHLAAHGLPVISTLPLTDWPLGQRPVVIKPDDGVGCEGSRIIPSGQDLPFHREGWIAQPLLQGEALSLSALFADGKARLLSVNRQVIESSAAGFVLKGCQVNAWADTDGRWQGLAEHIAQAIPGLWGYAGIDLILTGEGPVILEINPRLTTSYAGLRPATTENPAALILNLAATGQLPPPRRHPGKPVDIAWGQHHEH